MLHDMDVQLFLLINAPESASKFIIYFAMFCAQFLIYVPVVVMFFFWFFKPSYRQLIIKMLIALALALVVSSLIRHVTYFPRPFAVTIGSNYFFHEKTSSLPSLHGVFIWTICLTIYINYVHLFRKLLYSFVVIAFLVCWGRIYLGIHWPLDMIASFIISLFSTYAIRKYWFVIQKALVSFL